MPVSFAREVSPPSHPPAPASPLLYIGTARLLLTAFLVLLTVIMAVRTLHWPWTNDAQVFHYAVFLMGRGLAPYRQILDINLPGSYLSEWLGMHLHPDTDLSYRLYDLLLLAAFGWAATVIARPYNWFAGVLAAALFALIHASEGAWMLGERDLVMAVLLTGSYALTFAAIRPPGRSATAELFAAAALLSLACTLKPFAVLYALPLFGLALVQKPAAHRSLSISRAIPALLAGAALIAAATAAFLFWRSSLPAFLQALRLAAAYSTTNRTGLAYMLHHSTPRGLYVLLPPALALAILNRSWRNREFLSLYLAVLLGLLSYFLQNKGFIYHRYPWVAFALLSLTLECTQSLRSPARSRQILAIATLAIATFAVAPFYLYRTFHMPPNNRFATALVADLQTLQQSGTPLDTHIQCLDGIAGCYSALYRLRLQSSTGFLGDQLLFQAQATPAIRQARALFQQQLARNPPTVFVETDYWYGGPQQFTKTATWPAFDSFLRANYTLVTTRTFPEHPTDIDPIGYRIYLRHP